MELGRALPQIATPPPGPLATAWIARLAATECPAFTARRARRAEASGAAQDPIVWAEARGANVLDVDGNRYVDLTGGFGVAAVGHAHPEVRSAILRQSERLVHALGDLHPSDVKIQLLERLAELAPFGDARVVLSLSGADAVETALKTAVVATARAGVLAFEGGYHGLAHGPLAACGYSAAFRRPFEAQLNPHVVFAPFPTSRAELAPCLSRVRALLDDRIGAVLVEPVQGRGGVRVAPDGFLPALRDLAHERGALLVADEILTGLGRCGVRWRSGETADLLCVGKALGGGMPISACIGRPEVMETWGTPDGEALHTGTFFGHPLGCAAALAALNVIEREGLAARASRVGKRFAGRLREAGFDVAGEGLMLGIRRPEPVLGLVHALLARGFLTLPCGQDARTLQLLPPLTIDPALLDAFVVALKEATS